MCEVGKRIRNRRIELGYSAEELAPMVGLSPATIYRYENGDIKKVSTNKVKPFAAALKTSEAFLMGWTDDPSEKVTTDDSHFEKEHDFDISERAIEIAKAYDSMSDYGRAIIDCVIAQEEKRQKDSYGKTKLLTEGNGLEMKKIQIIKMAHPSQTQAKYNSKQELKELAEEENRAKQENT